MAAGCTSDDDLRGAEFFQTDLRDAWFRLSDLSGVRMRGVDLSNADRHLVLATDGWLGQSILGRDNPFHPLGLLFSEWQGHEEELGLDTDATPTHDEVLEARASRIAMVRDLDAIEAGRD